MHTPGCSFLRVEVMASYLLKKGVQVIAAYDGENGLRLARAHKPELIFLDVMIPGIDGFETCRRLKADEEFPRCYSKSKHKSCHF